LVDRAPYDGIYICTRTHSRPAEFADQFGFNEPIVAEYQRRYGVNIRTEPFSKSRWWDLQGEYLTQLLREIRAALPGKKIAIAIPRADHLGAPYGNMRLDWRTWVEEGLIDALVVSVYSGRFLYPDENDRPGYVQSEQDGLGIRPLEYDIEKWFGPACQEHGVDLYLRRSSIITDKARELLDYPGVRGFMAGF